MSQKEIIIAFIELGKFLTQFSIDGNKKNPEVKNNEIFFDEFENLISLTQSHNGWFTPEQVHFSINSWASTLTENNLNNWINKYTFNKKESKTIGLILAGNIPLVGFHDFLSVLITGHKALAKLSSNDQKLLPFLAKYLISITPKLAERITFTEEKLENLPLLVAQVEEHSWSKFV